MNLFRKKEEMETPRLLLRRWQLWDFSDFQKFDRDPDVMPASGIRASATLSDSQTSFNRAMRDDGCFAIVLKETGEAIGKIKFQTDNRRTNINCLSIGYQLRKDMWGRGLMPEALKAMVVCAFERKKVDVLAISHFSVNDRSRRVIEKCGFKLEGVTPRAFRRFDGQVFDDVCYSILREDYLACREKWAQDA